MSAENIDLGEVIALLESKRAAIDTAIASLKALTNSGALGPSEGTSYINLAANVVNPSTSSGEVPDGVFHGKTLPAGIKLYLSLMNKKQTVREISDGLKKGGMESTSKWFDKIIYATLGRLRKSGEIVKIEGNWGLPEWYPALMRAGIGDNSQKPKRKGRPRKMISKADLPNIDNSPDVPMGNNTEKLSRKDAVAEFIKTNGPSTRPEIMAATGIGASTYAFCMKDKGRFVKGEDGKWRNVE